MIASIVLAGLAMIAVQEQGSVASEDSSIRVLVITGGHEFERTPFFEMFDSFPGITWRETIHPNANSLYAPKEAATYDVIVLYDLVQDITEAQKLDFVRLLREDGKGLVCLHHCIGDYQRWPEFRRILGGRYYLSTVNEDGVEHKPGTFDHDQQFVVRIAEDKHPVTRGLRDFRMEDELYNNFEVDAGVTELLRVDHPKSGSVVGWTHQYGKANVVYIQMGHGPSAFTDENYRALVQNAIRWAAANSYPEVKP